MNPKDCMLSTPDMVPTAWQVRYGSEATIPKAQSNGAGSDW
jgi:hypothetical protein